MTAPPPYDFEKYKDYGQGQGYGFDQGSLMCICSDKCSTKQCFNIQETTKDNLTTASKDLVVFLSLNLLITSHNLDLQLKG